MPRVVTGVCQALSVQPAGIYWVIEEYLVGNHLKGWKGDGAFLHACFWDDKINQLQATMLLKNNKGSFTFTSLAGHIVLASIRLHAETLSGEADVVGI